MHSSGDSAKPVCRKTVQGSNAESLPKLEVYLYFATFMTLLCRGYYAIFELSDESKDRLSYAFVPGWSILGRNLDDADGEWSVWRRTMANGFYKWIIGHIIMSITMNYLSASKNVRSILLTVCGIAAVCGTVGWKGVVVSAVYMIMLCGMAFLAAFPPLIWVVSIVLLFRSTMAFLTHHVIFEPELPLLAEYGISMSVLRIISCSLKICSDIKRRAQQTNTENISPDNTSQPLPEFRLSYIMDIVCYVFYLPLFFAGPMMIFDDFRKQLNQPLNKPSGSKLAQIVSLFLRTIFWGVVLEAAYHYIYVYAIIYNVHIIQHTNLWAVAGVGLAKGIFFLVKYFVIWAGCGALAMLDQFEPPGPPSCINRIYRYSQTWKTFDRGLYGFMFSHIYVPLGGSRQGFVRQLIASFLCFSFVCVWHGMYNYIIVWILLNYLGVSVEAVADKLAQTPFVSELESKHLSPAMRRRLHSIFTIPLSAMSHFAIFTFFGGSSVGYTIFYRLIIEGFPTSFLVVCLFEYTFIQTSKEIERWEAARKTRSKTD